MQKGQRDQQEHAIKIWGASQNNLKGFNLTLPREEWIVITGLSGSGKSSLAFETLFAEGQRRYLESLSFASRTLIRQLPRAEVDWVEGLPPTLAVGLRSRSPDRRATVGTETDIHQLLALLFGGGALPHSPETGEPLLHFTQEELLHALLSAGSEGDRFLLMAPLDTPSTSTQEYVEELIRLGYLRLRVGGKGGTILRLDEKTPPEREPLDLVIDRFSLREGIEDRLRESIRLALDLGNGRLLLGRADGTEEDRLFSTTAYCSHLNQSFPPLRSAHFLYNSPYGACPICEGSGWKEEGILCESCDGLRLNPYSLAARLDGKGIAQIMALTLLEAEEWIASLQPKKPHLHKLYQELLPRIRERLECLIQLGLGYLTLDRSAPTLSTGELRRVDLAAQISQHLTGLLYILDEPSQGLHPKDLHYLKKVLQGLKERGNTLVVVEHSPPLIEAADWIVELGPGAGRCGGELLYSGPIASFKERQENSPTAPWLRGERSLLDHARWRKESQDTLTLSHLSCHHLKDLTLSLPLGRLIAIAGPSGSGKSTLLFDEVAPRVTRALQGEIHLEGVHGEPPHIQRLLTIEQRFGSNSPRSFPATYLGIFPLLRQLLAETPLARMRGIRPADLSLHKRSLRCERCEGLGIVKMPMNFLPDFWATCDQCEGTRYQKQALQLRWKGHNIAEWLDLAAEEALPFFEVLPQIYQPLSQLVALGMGYLKLGQPFTTLSGGEMQRLSLVKELKRKHPDPTLYLMDEPSSGLHLEDTLLLLKILQSLVDEGHTVCYISHDPKLLQTADWIIELGPGSGAAGGEIVWKGRANSYSLHLN